MYIHVFVHVHVAADSAASFFIITFTDQCSCRILPAYLSSGQMLELVPTCCAEGGGERRRREGGREGGGGERGGERRKTQNINDKSLSNPQLQTKPSAIELPPLWPTIHTISYNTHTQLVHTAQGDKTRAENGSTFHKIAFLSLVPDQPNDFCGWNIVSQV